MTPVRIQRRRTKGWRMPDGAIYVGRPSRWGNPFVAYDWQAAFRAVWLGERGDRAGMARAAVKLYRLWLTGEGKLLKNDDRNWFEREVLTVQAPRRPTDLEIQEALRGKDLVCWCPLDEPCHADVLLEIANTTARRDPRTRARGAGEGEAGVSGAGLPSFQGSE